MLVLIGQLLLRNAGWVGVTTMWYGWNWIFPSKKEKMEYEMYNKINNITDYSDEVNKEIINIKNMIRNDLNLPEQINMNEYIQIINNQEKMTASGFVENGKPSI